MRTGQDIYCEIQSLKNLPKKKERQDAIEHLFSILYREVE